MKRLLQTTFLIGLLTLGFSPVTFSQNIDANRMNRDIRIMENILGELFKMQATSSQSGTATFTAFGRSAAGVRGTYLPGFGVIFSVSNNSVIFNGRVVVGNGDSGFSFYYGDEEDEEEEALTIDEESVRERITEFLQNYASTIGQLEGDDRVMVIFGSSDRTAYRVYNMVGARLNADDSGNGLPVISGSAKATDLRDYRSGKINENNFAGKISFASSENKEYRDLKILADIFENALKEQDKDSFRALGKVDYLLLDNFGALYSFDVRYSDFRFPGGTYALNLSRSSRSGRVSVGEVSKADLEEKEEEYQKNLSEAYTDLVQNVKEYMVDYGRTLNTLNSDQFLLLSISVHGRHDDIPERLDIQLKKSVLEQFDRGRLTREQALDQVVVTEY
jgi:hypothetical protein